MRLDIEYRRQPSKRLLRFQSDRSTHSILTGNPSDAFPEHCFSNCFYNVRRVGARGMLFAIEQGTSLSSECFLNFIGERHRIKAHSRRKTEAARANQPTSSQDADMVAVIPEETAQIKRRTKAQTFPAHKEKEVVLSKFITPQIEFLKFPRSVV